MIGGPARAGRREGRAGQATGGKRGGQGVAGCEGCKKGRGHSQQLQHAANTAAVAGRLRV